MPSLIFCFHRNSMRSLIMMIFNLPLGKSRQLRTRAGSVTVHDVMTLPDRD
jgi:hypothetical protein